MNRKTFLISLTISLALALILFGVALAASKTDTNGPDSPDCYMGITIIKKTEPSGGTGFGFTSDRSGDTWWGENFSLADNGERNYTNVGYDKTYTITETTIPNDWHLKKISCTDSNTKGYTNHLTYNYTSNSVSFFVPEYYYVTCIFTNVKQMDYGDLPDTAIGGPPYNMTTWDEDGARHYPGDLFLGASIDAESDGQPDSGATGDDTNASSDEDGVARLGQWGTDPSGKGTLRFTVTGGAGCLFGWLDYANESTHDLGADGKFSTFTYKNDNKVYDEYIIQNVYVHPGTNDILFDLPTDFGNLVTFSRFRLFTLSEGGCHSSAPSDISSPTIVSVPKYFGFANNGEVEDYSWAFGPTAITLQSFEGVATNSSLGALMVILLGAAVLGLVWRILRNAHG
jgi:hypothetical protein